MLAIFINVKIYVHLSWSLLFLYNCMYMFFLFFGCQFDKGWAKKSKPAYFCNNFNFVYCQPIFIIFGTYTL